MRALVFSQAPALALPLAALVTAATRRGDLELSVLGGERGDGLPGSVSDPAITRAALALESAALGHRGQFSLRVRAVTPADQARARAAELRGQAAGMAALAARCPTAWEVEALGDAPATALWHLTAVLAFVALGPVLPEDDSTLFGVRGAMQRAGG